MWGSAIYTRIRKHYSLRGSPELHFILVYPTSELEQRIYALSWHLLPHPLGLFTPRHILGSLSFSLSLFKILFIYSWETQRKRQRHRQREKQAPCREPDAELDPRTPGSHPGLKAGAQSLSHPGAPCLSSMIIPQRLPSPSPQTDTCNEGVRSLPSLLRRLHLTSPSELLIPTF